MSGELERFDPAEQRGRIAYEHLHRYAVCRDLAAGKRVLDLGCGAGYGTFLLSENATQAVGVEINADAVHAAKNRYQRENLKYVTGNCFDLPFENGSFDLVVANEIIEHVENQRALIAEAKRVLVDGGLFVVSTPNKPVYNRYKEPNCFHVSELEIAEFERLLRENFEYVSLSGQRMALVSVGFLLSGQPSGTNLAEAKLYRGLLANGAHPSVTNDEIQLDDPEYVLAYCSDEPIEYGPAISTIFFSRENDLWAEHEKILAWASGLHEEDEVLRASLRQAQAELNEKYEAIAALETRENDLAKQLSKVEALASLATPETHLATPARLLERLIGSTVQANSASVIEAFFSLQEKCVLQSAELKRLADAEARAALLEAELASVTAKAERQTARSDDLQSALNDAREAAAASERRAEVVLSQMRETLEQSHHESQRLGREIDRERTTREELERRLNGEIERLRTERGGFEREITDLQQERDSNKAQLTEAKILLERLQSEVGRSEDTLRDLNRELDEMRVLNREKERIEARQEQIERENEQLKKELDAARRNATAVPTQLKGGEDEPKELSIGSPNAATPSATRHRALTARIASAQQRRQAQLSEHHDRLREELSAARVKIRGLVPHANSARTSRFKRLTGRNGISGTLLFDRRWIKEQAPDLPVPTLRLYLRDAAYHAVSPHPLFASADYLARYPDVAEAGVSPLQHYLEYGWREGRDPHPYFANDWYLQQNPDVLKAGANPLEHYLAYGWKEGRPPNPVFNPLEYLERYPDVKAAGVEPLTHYIKYGRSEKRDIPFHGLEHDWRSLVPHNPELLLMDHLLSDQVLIAKNASTEEPRPDADDSWPPRPLNDFWPPQALRDFIIEAYGEPTLSLYWFLYSVMDAFEDNPDDFASSDVCQTIIERIKRRSAERAAVQSGKHTASIIVPVYNNFLDTILCIASVLELESAISFEIVVADDGSSDVTSTLIPTLGGIVRHLRQPRNLGFLGNCNAAAAVANGEIIVLLNNDTLALPGWLDGLLAPFDRSPLIGLVGSKLINWDGSLQEAGGIFWNDGSAWNFGRGGDPLAPEFNYLKEVDYCSGASIAVPAKLWREMEGFDPAYAPAYCEDSDLAFRLRNAGYRTLYNPESEIIHHEGRSHGRDLESGIKAYQVANQQHFFQRWRDVLAQEHFPNASNVLRARDRSQNRIHVLLVDHYVPQWDRDAGSRTMYQYINILLELGFQLTFWPDNLYRDPVYTPALESLGVEVIYGAAFRNGFADFMRDRGDLYDAAFLSRPHIAPNYIPAIREHSNARILYYGHDLHFRRLQAARALGQPVRPEEIEQSRRIEFEVCAGCDVVFYPDPEEIRIVANAVGGDRDFIANPVFVYEDDQIDAALKRIRSIGRSLGKRLLFVGGFNHTPNKEGVIWFVKEVFPLIRKHFPDVTLDVVGSNPPPEIVQLEADGISVLGLVSDEELIDLYGKADVAVAPLRFGAGVKGKVIEAMALGVPVATTSVGAQGIEYPEEKMFLGDNPIDLGDAVIQALEQRKKARDKASAALEFISQNYSRHTMMDLFRRLITEPVKI
jgi:GT2 family glycosyltransferase/SAM-dependent methyltransferase